MGALGSGGNLPIVCGLSPLRAMRSVELPVTSLLTLCAKYAAGLIKTEMFTECSACIRIWHSKSDRKFYKIAPQYGALIAQRCADSDSIYLAACSLRDFCSNEVSDWFGEPVDHKGAILGLPYQMAGVVFVEYQKLLAIDDGLLASQPDDLCSAFDMVMTACRAIIAVSSPIPGLYDSNAAEVHSVIFAAGDDVDEDADEAMLSDLFGSEVEQDSKRDPQKTQAGAQGARVFGATSHGCSQE